MKSEQTQCLKCDKELTSDVDKKWIQYDKRCPKGASAISDHDSICKNCGSETNPESALLFCKQCFEQMGEFL